MVAIQFTLNTRNIDDIIDGITKYSQCVALGNCNCDDERKALEDASIPEMVFIFAIVASFINCTNLLFVIQIRDVKKLAKRATRSFISSDPKVL